MSLIVTEETFRKIISKQANSNENEPAVIDKEDVLSSQVKTTKMTKQAKDIVIHKSVHVDNNKDNEDNEEMNESITENNENSEEWPECDNCYGQNKEFCANGKIIEIFFPHVVVNACEARSLNNKHKRRTVGNLNNEHKKRAIRNLDNKHKIQIEDLIQD
ncbi:36769_t:CDS:2, partial [Racocetra persica]